MALFGRNGRQAGAIGLGERYVAPKSSGSLDTPSFERRLEEQQREAVERLQQAADGELPAPWADEQAVEVSRTIPAPVRDKILRSVGTPRHDVWRRLPAPTEPGWYFTRSVGSDQERVVYVGQSGYFLSIEDDDRPVQTLLHEWAGPIKMPAEPT